MRALVAWREGLFLTEGKIVVLSVLGCEPRSRDETPGGPEESRWTKFRHTYIRMCVQSSHVYIYVKRRDEILD